MGIPTALQVNLPKVALPKASYFQSHLDLEDIQQQPQVLPPFLPSLEEP